MTSMGSSNAQTTSGTFGRVDPVNAELSAIARAAMPELANRFTFFTNLALIITGWMAAIPQVILRQRMGEREFSTMRIYMAAGILIMWYAFFGGALLPWLLVVFIVLSVIERIGIWMRYQRGEAWHSYSTGISRLERLVPNIPIIGKGDWVFFRLYEPLLFAALSWLVSRMDQPTGVFMGFCAIAMALRGNIYFQAYRGRVLDLIDAQIESTYMNEAAFERTKRQIAGVAPIAAVWPSDLPTISGDGSFSETLDNVMGTPAADHPRARPTGQSRQQNGASG